MDTSSPVPPQPVISAVTPPVSTKTSWTRVILGFLVIIALVFGVLWWANQKTEEPKTFSLIENGEQVWYELIGSQVSSSDAPDSFREVPSTLLQEGDFSSVLAENGTVVTLSSEGLTTVDPGTDIRENLIERDNLDYGSSAVANDASIAALYNEETNALDIFLLDRTRPLVLSYVGSVSVVGDLYGVSFVDTYRLIVRTSETSFTLYNLSENTIVEAESATLKGAENTSWFSVSVAHAWTYPNPPSATNATTMSGQKCTGAQVANLGTASGTGTMPSVQSTVWSYMPNPGSLPANYNNGTYCIQALTSVTTSGGGEDDEGLLFDWGSRIFGFLDVPEALAQTSLWSIIYTAHSGVGVTAGTNFYTLTYSTSQTATLTASPSTINQGSSAALTWSSTNASSCTGTNFSTGNATSGTVSISPTSNTTYSLTCGTASDSETVTVASSYPNLTAGSIPIILVPAGTPITLSSTISNTGLASTGSGFYTLFQKATSQSGANTTDIGTYNRTTALPNSSNFEATLSYTFSSPATAYVRACADKNSASGAGTITESNESNNCGAWTAVLVVEPSNITVSLSASPSSISSGENTTLTWSSTNASFCASSQFDTTNATSGSVSVTPTANTTYTVTCYNPGAGGSDPVLNFGILAPGIGSFNSDSETVTVTQSAQADLIAGTTLVSGSPVVGTPATLSSTVTNYGGTAATNFPNIFQIENGALIASQSLTLTPSGAANDSDPISASYTFTTAGTYRVRACADNNTSWVGTVTESNESNNCSDWTTVVVTGGTQCSDSTDNDGDTFIDLADGGCTDGNDNDESGNGVTADLVATPTSVITGSSSTLTWSSSGASSCSGTGFNTGGATNNGAGVSTGPLTSNTNYQISCTGTGGTTNDTASVTVTNPTVSLTAEDTRVFDGGDTTLSWDGDQVISCTLTGTNGLSYTAGVDALDVPSEQITTQTTFTVSCDAGAATDTVIVNVTVDIDEF